MLTLSAVGYSGWDRVHRQDIAGWSFAFGESHYMCVLCAHAGAGRLLPRVDVGGWMASATPASARSCLPQARRACRLDEWLLRPAHATPRLVHDDPLQARAAAAAAAGKNREGQQGGHPCASVSLPAPAGSSSAAASFTRSSTAQPLRRTTSMPTCGAPLPRRQAGVAGSFSRG